MKKYNYLIFCLLVHFFTQAQFIQVNTSQYSVNQLVTDVLIDSPCALVSNITHVGSTTYGASQANASIGYFQNTNPAFPMSAGVVMSTGFSAAAVGPNNTTQSNSAPGWIHDPQTTAYLNSVITPSTYQNASILQFNFTPLTDSFSFNFVFASEEYGTYQCSFSDAFVFLLEDLNTGVVQNLAVIPGTNIPIAVTTVRNNLHNAGCASANAEYFSTYYGNPNGQPNASSPTNFNGHTVLMTASATVVPNTPYRIKLVIQDRQDTALDSAIFIEAGSFNVGTAQIFGTGQFDLWTGDFTGGAGLCGSECRVVKAGTSPIANATYSWKRNGEVITGANTYELEICEEGTYEVTVTIGGSTGCVQTDSIIVEFLPPPNFNLNPSDISSCTTFNLTINTPIVLNGLTGEVTYHTSLQDAANGANPITNPTAYPGVNGQEIWASIQSDDEPCLFTASFFLVVPSTDMDPQPQNISLCDVNSDNTEVFDLTTQVSNILNGLPASGFAITYHTTAAGATNETDVISTPTAYAATHNTTVYVRIEALCDPTNFATASFQLLLINLPSPDSPSNVTVCNNYVLPSLTVGNYFSGPNGTGTPYTAGQSITSSMTMYVYAETGT
ncbi:MAG: choice-of-anchor L domain-containing protein, partial [Flavobacterium sp.]